MSRYFALCWHVSSSKVLTTQTDVLLYSYLLMTGPIQKDLHEHVRYQFFRYKTSHFQLQLSSKQAPFSRKFYVGMLIWEDFTSAFTSQWSVDGTHITLLAGLFKHEPSKLSPEVCNNLHSCSFSVHIQSKNIPHPMYNSSEPSLVVVWY